MPYQCILGILAVVVLIGFFCLRRFQSDIENAVSKLVRQRTVRVELEPAREEECTTIATVRIN